MARLVAVCTSLLPKMIVSATKTSDLRMSFYHDALRWAG